MLDKVVLFKDLQNLAVREEISRAKFIAEDQLAEFDTIRTRMASEIEALSRKEGVV